MPRVLFAGHSHITALGVPRSTSGATGLVEIDHPGASFSGLVGAYPRDDAYWDAIIDSAPGYAVVLSWGGNQHNAKFLIARDEPFDFVASARPELPIDESAALIPERMVRAAFEGSLVGLHRFIERFVSAGAADLALLGTPAPKGDDAYMRERMAREPFFGKMAAELGLDLASVRLTPPLVRLKLWYVLQECMRGVARTHGIPFIDVPPSTQDDVGFLARRYWHHDATHANRAYGQVVLDDVAARYQTTGAATPAGSEN